jgi:DegV family protein with EDD domain
MKIALSAETTVDLPKELLAKYQIATVPFSLTLGEKTGLDGEILPEELFEYTDKTGKLAHTSAVNQKQYEDHFDELLKTSEAVIHFTLSSDISSAYQNAVNAAKEKKGVYVIDSRSLSTGIALLAIYARKLIDAGEKPEKIASLVKTRIPFDQASFVLESVNYLYKGGRCSALAMIGANLLHLKPEILVSSGKMIAGAKLRGSMLRTVMAYVEDMLAKFPNPDKSEIFITYSTVEPGVLKAVQERLKKEGFEHIIITRAGGTISCHCGPHCLGILYLNDGPHPIA